ncbi:MAG TPA: hypothetical protein VNJ46_03490 [Gaiellaceae bacterium]|nr:hypothetical protein [Gaiellaceae bacterium]
MPALHASEPSHVAGRAVSLERLRGRPASLAGALLAYAGLAALLTWSRLAGLGSSFCCDELATIDRFVREGPATILAGPYLPNNHQLFSLLAWATGELTGESEVAFRLWSAIPFVLGVLLVTGWLHVRAGALPGLVFCLLATFAPLLVDVTRQARGYGLAFLCMAVAVVAALEAVRSRSRRAVLALAAAGVVGTWTLPHLAIAWGVAFLAVLSVPCLRRAAGLAGAASAVAIGAWYAPHAPAILASSAQDYGRPIPTAWLLTAPLDQTLAPALTVIDDTFVDPGLGSLALVAPLAAVIAASPFLRDARAALVLAGPPVATVLAFWAAGSGVTPRFFTFLLVPLLVLVSTGTAAALSRPASLVSRLQALAAVAVLALVLAEGLPWLARIPRLPRESLRDAAAAIRESAPAGARVVAYMPYTADLEFFLGRRVRKVARPADVERLCASGGGAVLVVQPWLLPPPAIPCADRPGTRRARFEQYARGGRIDVWFLASER